MFIKSKSDLTIEDINENVYLPRIYFANTDILRMVDEAKESSAAVQELLNKINNQGISELSLCSRSYVRESELLGFDSLSSAERLFLVAYVANVSKTGIIVAGEVGELTKSTLILFFKEFGSSEYINVSSPDGWFQDYYVQVKEGVH